MRVGIERWAVGQGALEKGSSKRKRELLLSVFLIAAVSILGACLRRGATTDFSPAFQGRDQIVD